MDSNSSETALFRVDGVFDAEAARDLAQKIAKRGGVRELYIDMSRVREFHDLAVTLLGNALAGNGAQVFVRGLRQHHRRVLAYLGIDTGPDFGRDVSAA